MDIRSSCESINIHWAIESDECVKRNGPIPIPYVNPVTEANMIGNVAEWTEDCYRPNYNDAPADGSAVSTPDCAERVFRGGWWRTASNSPVRLFVRTRRLTFATTPSVCAWCVS